MNEFIQTDRKRVGEIVTSEETITIFQVSGVLVFIAVFPCVYDGHKEEKGNQSF